MIKKLTVKRMTHFTAILDIQRRNHKNRQDNPLNHTALVSLLLMVTSYNVTMGLDLNFGKILSNLMHKFMPVSDQCHPNSLPSTLSNKA
jgi:hypothetical protein